MTDHEQIRNQIIEAARATLVKFEPDGIPLKGGNEGLAIAARLSTPEEFQEELQARYEREKQLYRSPPKDRAYWRHRSATIQIEFVYERMQVLWDIAPINLLAKMQVEELLRAQAAASAAA
jgi:hypothetical protein